MSFCQCPSSRATQGLLCSSSCGFVMLFVVFVKDYNFVPKKSGKCMAWSGQVPDNLSAAVLRQTSKTSK